jgi:hypothetical protein
MNEWRRRSTGRLKKNLAKGNKKIGYFGVTQYIKLKDRRKKCESY